MMPGAHYRVRWLLCDSREGDTQPSFDGGRDTRIICS